MPVVDGQLPRSLRRLIAVVAIAVIATALAWALATVPISRDALAAVDWAAYDAAYKSRAPQSRDAVPVTLVEVDAQSLAEFRANKVGWPWPRGASGWADVIRYLERHGARAVVFDLLFNDPSALGADDDEEFAQAIDQAKVPLVFASTRGDGEIPAVYGSKPETQFAPPVKKRPTLGKVEILGEQSTKVYRLYEQWRVDGPWTLADAAIVASGMKSLRPRDAFALRYHGPHIWPDGKTTTYRSVRASAVVADAIGQLDLASPEPPDDLFRGRIVILGATAAGLHDLKSTPVQAQYPGSSVHATAIDNLLNGDEVRLLPRWLVVIVALASALLVAMATVAGRSWWVKLATAALVLAAIAILSTQLMLSPQMRWLAPTVPVLAIIGASVGGLVWSYRIEDARARMLLRAVTRCVSPAVADALSADPRALTLGGQRREMTAMFSDMQGFTDLTDVLREKIEPLLNFYLGEISSQALSHNGTIDKFVGDAMMVFWNAPLRQADHALYACRAALAIVKREREIASDLIELGAKRPWTRIGIHTGPMIVGFFGSSERLSYTAVGDAVNLASRLETANKFYGTQILVSDDTAEIVKGEMLLRPVDRLRVYGRHESNELFELIGERASTSDKDRMLCALTRRAVDAYRRREFSESRRLWVEILELLPDDGLARLYLARLDAFDAEPPPPDWDGTYIAESK